MSGSIDSSTESIRQKLTWHHIGFVLACASMEFVCVGAWFNTAGIFYHDVAEEFGIGLGQVGLYLSITFFSTVFVLPPGGRLLERGNARLIYAVTNVLMLLAFVINTFATNIYMMYVSGLLAGAMGAFDMYLIPVMIARWFEKRTGFVVGLTSGLSGVGPAIWNIAIAAVIASAGWRIGYATLAIVVAVVVIPLSVAFIRSYPEEVGVRPFGALLNADAESEKSKDAVMQVKISGADFTRVVKSPAFYLMIIMAMTAGMAVMMSQYLTSFALDIGYVAMIGAAMTSAAMVGNMLSKIVFGTLSDKSVTLAVLGPIVLPIIGFVGLMLIGGGSAIGVIAMAFLYGTIQPNNVTILPLAVRSIFGDKDYSRIWSIISACSSFACGIGSSIWGFVYDATATFYGVFTVGIILLLIRLAAYFIAIPSAKKIPHTEEVKEITAKSA